MGVNTCTIFILQHYLLSGNLFQNLESVNNQMNKMYWV